MIKVVNKNTAGVQMSIADQRRLESLFKRDLLAPLYPTVLAHFPTEYPEQQLESEEKYIINNAFIRALVRSKAMSNEPRAETVIGDLAGFGFEDFVSKWIEERDEQGKKVLVDELDLGPYRTCQLFFADLDIDLVLARHDAANNTFEVILGSLKFSESAFLHKRASGEYEMTHFVTENVAIFLRDKMGGSPVSHCIIVGMVADESFNSRETINGHIQRGKVTTQRWACSRKGADEGTSIR
ncbi:hypothetical protein HDU85_000640 [Gaertneriomyces sp. JEL0708]|nr:hypothetical protein HDU85_000640 [Gaertneriomyces sp. JEL0708]